MGKGGPGSHCVNCLYKNPVLHIFVTLMVSGNSSGSVFTRAQVKSNYRNKLSGQLTQVSLLECDLATAAHDVCAACTFSSVTALDMI